MHPASEQMKTISSGVSDIVPADAMEAKLSQDRPLVIKLGVDPTAPDLHLGHAVPLRKLRQFQDLGHTVVLIIGDFTALIGDPSGRSTTRPALTPEEIEANAATYMEQAFKILDRERTVMRRNSEWLGPLGFSDILRLTSQFTVARIMERDDFQKRYREGVGISLHELLYPMAQAYDSVAIKSDVELGGSDQLFNLLAGRELMEKLGLEPQVCLTLPLLEGTDGVQKMSKSYGNYIGLTDAAGEMFGKVMSIPDTLMLKYYRLCTALPVDEIEALEAELDEGTVHPNDAKRRLAREIVGLYHDPGAAAEAEEAFDRVFKHREMPVEIPEARVERADPVHLPAVLKSAGLASTTSEARRLIDGGAVKIDGEAVDLLDGTYDVPWEAVAGRVLQAGKRRYARIVE
ncbi:MAG: tyrosine--tRNA ligase [Coriobacteriia bacterium]|nr:tyrosine--tRNA ligase [Coriobacteriia bacterium]